MQENKVLGGESTRKELSITSSTYYRCVQLQRHPERRDSWERQCEAWLIEIKQIYDDNHSLYDSRKVLTAVAV